MNGRNAVAIKTHRGLLLTSGAGFTLIELLLTVAILSILASLLAAALTAAKGKARRATCMNDLRQITLGVRMYSDDANDRSPTSTNAWRYPYTSYKELMKSYVNLRGTSSAQDKLFSCPADTFYYEFNGKQPVYVAQSFSSLAASEYSSYLFNGGNQMIGPDGGARPGITGMRLSAVKHPSKTILIFEYPAMVHFSWHKPKWPKQPAYFLSPRWSNCIFSNALNMAGFVDGHVSYEAIYWKGLAKEGPIAADYDPPAGYDYQWSGN
jgi:prepilin-type N-terminal cleavage/methylation domain-containing protein